MKRLSALLLLLLAMTLVFTACNENKPSTDTTIAAPTTTAAPETEPPVTDLEIIKDGVSNYTIIRSEDATKSTIDAATLTRELIGRETGVHPNISTDWVKRGTELDHTTLEILVGPTNYSESAEALKGIPYGDYIVTRVDNKLVVNAWSADGLATAVSKLGEELIKNASTDNFSLPADIKLTGTSVEIVNALPLYEGGELTSIYDAGNKNRLVVIEETNLDAYKTYRKTLEGAGYTLYDENTIVDNTFATYTNDTYTITVGYYAYEESTRIIIEPKSTLFPREADNKYEDKGVTPTFTMLGLQPSGNNGMSFVFQLADGSYVIFDGGFNKDRDASFLYKHLRDNAPDKNNIVIAAWFITHAHGDHHGCYTKFASNYGSKVTLEYLVGNFPSDEARLEGGLGTEGSGGASILTNLKKFKGAQFIKAHVGQKLHLRNATFEILYTLESYAPGVLDYFNTSSLITRVTIGGQTFNITGDASNYACDITQKMYKDYLKCDFIQMAHHGYGTGTSSYKGVTTLYDYSAGPIVIWPVADVEIPNMLNRAYDAHLYNLATTKEVFVAGNRDVTLKLPYTVGTSGLDSVLK